jgi:drug/metabolite transporter (DMT)-like permease
MIAVFILYALRASTFSVGKVLLSYSSPLFLIGARMILAGTIFTTGIFLFSKKVEIRKNDVWLFWVLSLIHILVPYTTEFWALQFLSPCESCLFYNLSPFFSALFSYFIFEEEMTWKKWIGFLIGLGGMMYFMGVSNLFCMGASAVTNGVMLISVITSSFAWIMIRLLVKNRGYSIFLINAITMLFGGMSSLGLSYLAESDFGVVHGSVSHFLILLGIMIFVANGLFYNLYGYLLRFYTATMLSFVGFTTPLFAAFFEWIIFGTQIPTHFFASVAIVSVGIILFYSEELKQEYIS